MSGNREELPSGLPEEVPEAAREQLQEAQRKRKQRQDQEGERTDGGVPTTGAEAARRVRDDDGGDEQATTESQESRPGRGDGGGGLFDSVTGRVQDVVRDVRETSTVSAVEEGVRDLAEGAQGAAETVTDATKDAADIASGPSGGRGAADTDAGGQELRPSSRQTPGRQTGFERGAGGGLDVEMPSKETAVEPRRPEFNTTPEETGQGALDAVGGAVRDFRRSRFARQAASNPTGAVLVAAARAEPDQEIARSAGEGGLLAESPDVESGSAISRFTGITEQDLQQGSRAFGAFVEGAGRDTPEEEFIEGAASVGNLPAAAQGVEQISEVADPETAGKIIRDPRGGLETGVSTGTDIAESAARSAQRNPLGFAGSLTGAYLAGAGVSRVAGRGVRGARGRIRTAGGQRVNLADVTGPETRRNIETGGQKGTEFPGADDPELYETKPAEAVRQQAEQYTPDIVEEAFEEQVSEGVTLKKALGDEPEGPGTGRASQGFEAAPGETEGGFEYETPGAFVGPELSPNFLRLEGGRGVSLRPGLPGFGGRPTGVLAKTDVEEPDASSLGEFRQELQERAGETTARTKPPGEGSPGEIEAVIPPGAKFEDVGGGRVRDFARRLGIGADFYTEVGGQRVPLRPVVPSDRGDADIDTRRLDDDTPVDAPSRGDRDGGGRTISEITERPRVPDDRTTPLPPVDSPTGVTADASRQSQPETMPTETPVDSPSEGDGRAGGGGRGPTTDGPTDTGSVPPDRGVPTDPIDPVPPTSSPPGRPSEPGPPTSPPSTPAPPSDPGVPPSSSPPPGGPGTPPPTRPQPFRFDLDQEEDRRRRRFRGEYDPVRFKNPIVSPGDISERFTALLDENDAGEVGRTVAADLDSVSDRD